MLPLRSFTYRCTGFLILGSLSLLLLHTLRKDSALSPLLTALPQDPYIQVYFNHNEANLYSDPYRDITRYGDNLEETLIEYIYQAEKRLDIAIHELNLPLIAQAICDRNSANVEVRLILENSYNRPWAEYSAQNISGLDTRKRSKYDEFLALADLNKDGKVSQKERQQRDALYLLKQCQVPILDDTADGSKGSGLMHHKFMVIDGQTLIMGSANWTLSGIHGDLTNEESRGNANALLAIKSAPLADLYTQEFELMWGDGPLGQQDSLFGLQKPYRHAQRITSIPGSAISVQFSPTSATQSWDQSVNGLIAKTLKQASTQVDMSLFVFSDQAISNTLEVIAQRGVQIRTLLDPGFAYRSYSEGLDLLGTAIPDHRCKFEAKNRPWQTPILSVGIPRLLSGDKLHHKFALIDNQTVIIGSQNWSKAANRSNDENLLIIQNPTVAAHFEREFERLMKNADLGITSKLSKQQQDRRQQCS